MVQISIEGKGAVKVQVGSGLVAAHRQTPPSSGQSPIATYIEHRRMR
jgi:hypothetical protein